MNNVIHFKKKEDDAYKTNIYYRLGKAKALLNHVLNNDSLTTIERSAISNFINSENNIKVEE